MLDDRGDYYYKGNITMSQIYEWFGDVDLKDARIKLCGVLGDPIINPECIDICSYLIYEKRIQNIELSTNGGTRPEQFWKDLADLSYESNKLWVHWSIDGVERNDYRENVSIAKVWQNFETYHSNKGNCVWQYINFDYNTNEIEAAKRKAEQLGIELKIRVSWRNTANAAKFKSSESLKIDSDVYETVENRARLGEYEAANIVCRHQIENEIFVTSEGLVWPCCHLQDEQVSGKTNLVKKLGLKNDLKKTSLHNIITSPWYERILIESWDKKHPDHLPRCYLSCGDFAKRKVIK
jgi:hypothetical protein